MPGKRRTVQATRNPSPSRGGRLRAWHKYVAWQELLNSYQLSKKTQKNSDTHTDRFYLEKQIVWHYFKNFFLFPVWFFKLLTPSYFKGPVNVWTNLHTILRSHEFRPLRMAVVSQALFLFIIIKLGIFVFYYQSTPAYTATYGWIQTNWIGGVSTTAAATHTSDRTGWTQYTSSTLVSVYASPGNVVIATSSYTTTDDATLTTDGLASGGGFGNGATSTVEVSGGDVTLSVASAGGEVLDWDSAPLTLPATISGTDDGNGVMVTDGDDAFYILRGGGTTGFYKFVPSTATTSTLTSVPSAIPPNGGGGSLVLSGNYIYVYSGGNSGPKFYAYSIADDSWTTLTNPPSAPYGDGIGSSMAADASGNIYLAAGGATTNFYKYTVSTAPSGSWSSAYTFGSSVRRGSRAIYDSVNNDILVLSGNNGHSVFKFDIDSSTVTSYAGANNDPGFTTGATMAVDTTNNRVYALSGQSYGYMEILNLSNGTWNSRQSSSTPVGSDAGAYMIKKEGEKRIYTSFGGTSFYYFSTDGAGSWQMTSNTSPVPASMGQGATLIRHGNDEIYALLGGGSSAIYRFAINSGTQYNTSGNLISATIDLKFASSTYISWSATTPANTGSNAVKFQVAANTDNSTWNYVGPDGTASTYFTTSNTALPDSLNGKRYYRYKAYLTTSNSSYTPTLHSVTFTYDSYRTSGGIASSPFNTLDGTNVPASIAWTQTVPTGTSIKFQVRTSADNNTWTSWMGPDGTEGTYFTDNTGAQDMPAALSDGTNDNWIQYQAYFVSDGTATPVLADATFTYVVNAPPEISITSSTLSVASDGVLTVDYTVRDIDTDTGATTGYVAVSLQYCTANCSSSGSETWATAAAGSLTGNFGSSVTVNALSPTEYTSHSLTWTPTSSYNNQYNGSTFKIRLVADDSEAANNTGNDESNVFVLDTTDPVVSLVIDGRTSTTTLTFSVTEDTQLGMQMKLSNNSSLASDGLNADSGTWIPYASTSTWNLGSGGTTVYYQIKDRYGNVSAGNAISSGQTPQIPGNLFFKDISNAETSEWREFIAWQIIDEPTPGFSKYTIYRSTDGSTYEELATQVSRVINYYLDTDIDTGTTYYYKVTSHDTSGNVSSYSTVVSDDPNGTGGTDVASPSITNVATSTITPDSVTITWDTDEVSDSYVDYITVAGGDFSGANTVGITTMRDTEDGLGEHSVVLTDLTPETTYYFRVRSIDPDGNQGTGTQEPNGYSFTTLSGPTISNVITSEILNTEATITWTTNQESDSYVVFSTSSSFTASTTVGSPTSVTSHSVTLPSLTQNTTYFYYVVSGISVDKNTVEGQHEYYSFTTTADLTAPTITFDVDDDVTVSDTSIIVTFVTNEPATSSLQYGTSGAYGSSQINNNLNTDHRYSLTDLLPGTLYYFSLQVSDEDENVSSATQFNATTTNSADVTAPTISSVTTTVVTDDQALIEWSTDEGATGRVWYGTTSGIYGSSSNLSSSYNRSHAITLSSLTTSTAYYYIVASVDSSGNSATSSEYGFTTLETLTPESEVILREEEARAEGEDEGRAAASSGGGGGGGGSSSDKTAPIISGATVTDITSQSATFTWNTDEAGDSVVEFGETNAYGRGGLIFENTKNHKIVLTDLDPLTKYFYRLSSADAAGNRSTFFESSFSTLSLLEDANTIASTTASDDLETEEVQESFLASLEKVTDFIRTMATRVSVGVLESSLLKQSDLVLELSSLLPLPAIGGQPVVETGSTYATVSWTTDKESNSLVSFASDADYLLSKQYTQTVGDSELMTTQHSVEIRGLQPSTLYHYRVISRTQTGAETRSQDFVFQTKAESTEIETHKIDIISSEEAVFSWNTTIPTESIVSYIPYRNGVLDIDAKQFVKDKSLTTKHSLHVKNLEAGVLYDIEISGIDSGGNTVSKTIKGFSTNDEDLPPIISQVTTDSAILPGGNDKIQVIISWITNEFSTTKVYYLKGFSGENTEFKDSTPLDSNYTKKHIAVIANFEPGFVYQFQVESTDSSGNTTRSKTYTLLTPRKEESVFQIITGNFESIFSWVGKLRS